MKTNIYIGLALILSSCGMPRQELSIADFDFDPSHVIDVSEIINADVDYRTEDLVSEIKIIPLETTEASVLPMENSVIVSEDYIYYQSLMSGGLVSIFDASGKFLKSFSRGQGPDELGFPYNIWMDGKTKRLFVYDGVNRKIAAFTPGGDLIQNFYTEKFSPSDFCVSGDQFVFLFSSIPHHFKLKLKI